MSENKRPGTILTPLETAEILKSVVQLHVEALATLTPLIKALEGLEPPGQIQAGSKGDEDQEEKKAIDLPEGYIFAIKLAGYKTVADMLRDDFKTIREKLKFTIPEMHTLRWVLEQQGMGFPPENDPT